MSLEDLREWLPLIVDAVVFLFVVVIGPLVAKWLREKASAERRRQIADGARVVYNIVEAIAKKTPGEIDDKLAAGMKRLADMLDEDLSDADRKIASAVFAAEAHVDKVRGGSLNLAELGYTVNVRPPLN